MSLIIFELLILLLLGGLCGLMLFTDHVKKISSLSISYSSFLILFILISLKNSALKEVIPVIITVTIVFSINLLALIAISKNIAESMQKD